MFWLKILKFFWVKMYFEWAEIFTSYVLVTMCITMQWNINRIMAQTVPTANFRWHWFHHYYQINIPNCQESSNKLYLSYKVFFLVKISTTPFISLKQSTTPTQDYFDLGVRVPGIRLMETRGTPEIWRT